MRLHIKWAGSVPVHWRRAESVRLHTGRAGSDIVHWRRAESERIHRERRDCRGNTMR